MSKTILTFSMEAVAGLCEHAKQARTRRMTMEARAAHYGEDKALTEQPDEGEVAEPTLWLVKDHGIYLMSNGTWDKEAGERSPVTYADGYSPDDEPDLWDRCRQAVGGDDFAVDVPLSWVATAVARRESEFRLFWTERQYGLQFNGIAVGRDA